MAPDVHWRLARTVPGPSLSDEARYERKTASDEGLPVSTQSQKVVKCHGVWVTSTGITPRPA